MKAIERNTLVLFSWGRGQYHKLAPEGMSLKEAKKLAKEIQADTHHQPGGQAAAAELLDIKLKGWIVDRGLEEVYEKAGRMIG
jgi:hypothetical protein